MDIIIQIGELIYLVDFDTGDDVLLNKHINHR